MNVGSKAFVNFEIDHPSETHNTFDCTNVDYIYLNDHNRKSYNGSIGFDSDSTTGTSAKTHSLLSEAYVLVPHVHKMTIAGGTYIVNKRLKYACCLKGSHHFIDRVDNFSLGGTTGIIEAGVYQRNLYMNEQLKCRSVQETYLDATMDGSFLDSADTYVFDAVNSVGELNNSTSSVYGQNKAFSERNKHFVFSEGNTDLAFYPGIASSPEDVLMADSESQNFWRTLTPYCTLAGNVLTWYEMIKIPLSHLSDFFKNMNYPLNNIAGLQLGLSYNQGTSVITYKNYTNGNATPSIDASGNAVNLVNFVPESVTYNARYGRTCPFLVSSATNGVDVNGSFLTMKQTGTGSQISLTIESSIGWPKMDSLPCRIIIPQITLSNARSAQIMGDPMKTILYKDFFLDDMQKGLAKGSQVNTQLQVSAQRATAIYILPFFSEASKCNNGTAQMLAPWKSCVSTAPTTCSYCRVSDLQIRIGNKTMFVDRPQYLYEQYDNLAYRSFGGFAGNATNCIFKNGLVTKEMWQKCYGVIKVDIADQELPEHFDASVKPNVSFTIVSGAANVLYDFIIIMEYERQLNIDIATGATLKP
jgi:hypothetical protein